MAGRALGKEGPGINTIKWGDDSSKELRVEVHCKDIVSDRSTGSEKAQRAR